METRMKLLAAGFFGVAAVCAALGLWTMAAAVWLGSVAWLVVVTAEADRE